MAPQQQPRTAQYYLHQEITPKRPPGWDPAYNRAYSFDRWFKDLTHWANSTDVSEEKQGSLLILQLGGLAREFVQDLNPAYVRDGAQVQIRGEARELNGLMYIMAQLRDKFENLWQGTGKGAE